MKILLTAFKPFNGRKWNVTEEVLPFVDILGASIRRLVLPVSYKRCFVSVRKALKEFNPDIIISFGEACYDKDIVVERRAHNSLHSRLSDEDGVYKNGERISLKGPEYLYSSFDINSLYFTSVTDSLPVSFSNDCGGFICNEVYYQDLLSSISTDRKVLFIHLSSSIYDFEKTGYNISALLKGII